MIKYYLLLFCTLNLNAAQQILVAQKEQKQESEYNKENDELIKDAIGLKEIIHNKTGLPKELSNLVAQHCDLSSTLDFPKFERKLDPVDNECCCWPLNRYNARLGKLNVACSKCKCFSDKFYREAPRLSLYHLAHQKIEQNIKSGFRIANTLIEIFNMNDKLTSQFLDQLYLKINDFNAIVTMIIFGYMYFRSKQLPPQLCFGSNPINNNVINNNYVMINNVKIPIIPYENSFSLEILAKVKNFLLEHNSLDELVVHIKAKKDLDCRATKSCLCCWFCSPCQLIGCLCCHCCCLEACHY